MKLNTAEHEEQLIFMKRHTCCQRTAVLNFFKMVSSLCTASSAISSHVRSTFGITETFKMQYRPVNPKYTYRKQYEMHWSHMLNSQLIWYQPHSCRILGNLVTIQNGQKWLWIWAHNTPKRKAWHNHVCCVILLHDIKKPQNGDVRSGKLAVSMVSCLHLEP